MLEKLEGWIKTFSTDETVAPKADHEWAETRAGLLIEAAMADGVLDQDERASISHALTSQLDLSDEEVASIIDKAVVAHEDRVEIHSLVRAIRSETDAEDRIASISEADQVGEDWNAVQERFRAVDRIEHPDVVCIHLRIAVFLATDTVVGISGFDHLPLRRLDFTVGDGDGRFVRFGLD